MAEITNQAMPGSPARPSRAAVVVVHWTDSALLGWLLLSACL